MPLLSIREIQHTGTKYLIAYLRLAEFVCLPSFPILDDGNIDALFYFSNSTRQDLYIYLT